jgi:hypothetical protein
MNLLFLNSFEYDNNSDFVEHLRSINDQRIWFNGSKSVWNDVENPNFAETLTRHGIGFTFNIVEDSKLLRLNKTSSDFRYSYSDRTSRKARPWSTGARSSHGLVSTFHYFDNFSTWPESTCRFTSFAVHSPFEVPLTASLITYNYGRDLNVWITPEIMQTDEDLRSFSPDHRNCYFEDERQLNYYKLYTQKNCEMECLSFIGEFLMFVLTCDSSSSFQCIKTAAVFLSF